MIPKVLLTIGCMACCVWAAAILATAKVAIQDLTGAVVLLTAVLCFLGVAILDKLDQLKKQAG